MKGPTPEIQWTVTGTLVKPEQVGMRVGAEVDLSPGAQMLSRTPVPRDGFLHFRVPSFGNPSLLPQRTYILLPEFGNLRFLASLAPESRT